MLIRLMEWLDEQHISESELAEMLAVTRGTSKLRFKKTIHTVTGTGIGWVYEDVVHTVPPGQVWTIYNINSGRSLYSTTNAAAHCLQLDLGSGWFQYGQIVIGSSVAGAPNQSSFGSYNGHLLPLKLTEGNRFRLYLAGVSTPVYTTIVYEVD